MKLNKKTIYKVKTQEAYNNLMKDAEAQGYRWYSGNKPTELDYWRLDKENTAVYIDGEGALTRGEFDEKDVTKPRYKEWSVIDYEVVPKIYPINFGCVGIDAPDFKTAYEIFSGYMKNRDNLIDMLNEKVYTVRVQGDNTTVITPDGKVATAKCHPDDEFDIVEGFRVALEKIKDSERKLTDDERAILNIFLTAGCTTLLVDKYIEMTGILEDTDICTINVREDSGSIYSEDVFEWLDDGEEYNIQELMKKYA